MTMDTIHWKEGGLGGNIYRTQGAKALAYILEPEPVTDKVASVAEELSLTLVSISGMDWNRDLSPWKAEKVFKGEEDFSGGADDFMEKLEQEVFPAIEEMAGPLPDHRMMQAFLFPASSPFTWGPGPLRSQLSLLFPALSGLMGSQTL